MEKLTKEKAVKTIDDLRLLGDDIDDEMAHVDQDAIMWHFINSVANGCYDMEEAIEVAKIVTLFNDLDFTRWYS